MLLLLFCLFEWNLTVVLNSSPANTIISLVLLLYSVSHPCKERKILRIIGYSSSSSSSSWEQILCVCVCVCVCMCVHCLYMISDFFFATVTISKCCTISLRISIAFFYWQCQYIWVPKNTLTITKISIYFHT